MQVTGSKRDKTTKKVSIRCMLDGHSFSSCHGGGLDAFIGELDAALAPYGRDIADVEFQLDTPRTVLVPGEVYTPEAARKYFAINNIALGPGECEVTVRSLQGDIYAIAVWDKAQVDYLNTRFGAAVRFTTPLLRRTWHSGRKMSLLLTAANVYINVFEGKMKYAEVFPVKTMADTLYYMETLNRVFPLREWPIAVAGWKARDMARSIRKYFGRVKIETEKEI